MSRLIATQIKLCLNCRDQDCNDILDKNLGLNRGQQMNTNMVKSLALRELIHAESQFC